MPHIHTNPGEHDHTVSAFVVRTDLGEPKVLLHLHKKLGRWLQFGGHIEVTEDPWQAITHELKEESGYDMSQLKILQPKERMMPTKPVKLHPVPIYHNTHSFSEGHFHTDASYAFVTSQEPRHAIAENESSEIKLLGRAEVLDLPADQTYESVRAAALFVFDTCLKSWEEVDPTVFD